MTWRYRMPGERDRCPACESMSLLDLDLHELHRGVEGRRTGFISGCTACGLVFVNPMPSDQAITDFYSPDGAWGAPRAGDGEHQNERAQGVASWRFDAIRDRPWLAEPPPGARALDFGCGDGEMLDVLQGHGWETWGIETAGDRAFRRHHRRSDVPAEPTFDLIVASHVLEHVAAPLALLRAFAAAARPGGHLLISVPRFDTLAIHRDYKYVINGRAHIVAYTSACMETLLARSGWKVVEQSTADAAAGGPRTARRLRVLAVRDDGVITVPPRPLDQARAALSAYHATIRSMPSLQRLGLLRLAAWTIETRRALKRSVGLLRYRLRLRTRLAALGRAGAWRH